MEDYNDITGWTRKSERGRTTAWGTISKRTRDNGNQEFSYEAKLLQITEHNSDVENQEDGEDPNIMKEEPLFSSSNIT